MSRFLQALAALLPTGFAWPRDPNSVLMRTLRGIAANYEALHNFTHATVARWQPATTTRLAEWEAATGLPDACFGADQTDAQRLALVLERLRGVTLPYADSSPSALGVIRALCESYGYTADVSYEEPFRVGRNGVGDPLGSPGVIYVDISSSCEPFRVGRDGVGDLLVSCTPSDDRLLCVLERIVAARFDLRVIVDGEHVLPAPPADVCVTAPNWSGLYFDPFSTQEPNFYIREEFDLASSQYVTSAISHNTGIWYFEATLAHAVWDAAGDYPFSGTDKTDITPWPHGGWAACADLNAQSIDPRALKTYTIHADLNSAQPDGALADTAYVYLRDSFAASPSFTPSAGSEAHITQDSNSMGFAINCDTGAWGIYLMDGTLYASGIQPAMVGVRLLAFIEGGGHTGAVGWHDLQDLRLTAQDMRIAIPLPMGAQPWSPEPALQPLASDFLLFCSTELGQLGQFEINIQINGSDPDGDYVIEMPRGVLLDTAPLLGNYPISSPPSPRQFAIGPGFGLSSGQFPQLAGNEALLVGQTWRLVHAATGRSVSAVVPDCTKS